MVYLNIDADFLDHPKTTRLVARLGKGAEVLLIRLWAYCGKYHYEDGKLAGYDSREIEALAKWWGKPGEMLPAMEAVGFVDQIDGVWTMANWKEHQGHILALKLRGKRMAEVRWGRLSGTAGNADSIADSSLQAMPEQCSNQPTYQPTNLPSLEADRGGGEKKGGAVKAEPQEKGRFAMPRGEALPSPLFPATAKQMLDACDEQIRAVKEASRKVPKMEVVAGVKVQTGTGFEPEAEAALEAWRARKKEIKRAMAG